ncbi:MAG: HNH endonuclease family protein, partial [Chitinophagales bacterium]
KLTEKFLGNFSTSKLTITPKLVLNKNNDDFYKSYLLNHRKPPAITKLKPSQKRLWQAYEYFYQLLKDKFTSRSGEELARFVDDEISNSLIFTTINVSDDLNAYKVFETLNARGVKLSPADLLKNYLFSKAFASSSSELEETERRWQSINDFLGKSDLPTFLRHYWNSRNELVRISNLFRTIKGTIQTPQQVFDLLNELEQLAPLYAAFENPADPIWTKEQRTFIRSLNLFGVSTWYSLMLIAKQNFSNEEFSKLLHDLNVITFRYNVISGLHTNEIEQVFNKLAIKIFRKEVTTASGAFVILKDIYIDDESFALAFATKELSTKRNKNLVKYVLVELENVISGTNHQYEDASSTIEHILPENPSAVWETFFPADQQEDYIYLIGNYTLLEEVINKKANGKLFNEKLPLFKSSSYKMSRDELNYTEWTPTIIRQHQDKMSRWACSAWKSHYSQNKL